MKKLTEFLPSPAHWIKTLLYHDTGSFRRVCLLGARMDWYREVVKTTIQCTEPASTMTRTLCQIIAENPVFRQRAESEAYSRGLPSGPLTPEGLISAFNDHPDTTFEEVHSVAEEADRRWMLTYS